MRKGSGMDALQRYALTAGLCLCASLTHAVSAASDAEAVDNPVAVQPLSQLSATLERPLFSTTRRPAPKPAAPVVSAPPPPPPPAPPSVVVLGIVSEDGIGHAAIRNGDKVMRVRMGDDVGGWTVESIEPRRLVLRLGERSVDFRLFNTQAKGVKAADATPQRHAGQGR
jgi:general secretion pathway protein N